MLTITNTPHHTGVKISGDYFDLDGLNQAIYHVIGDEEKYYNYAGARIRILGVSYNIRQAAQGSRNIERVFNGLHEHVKKQHTFIAPDKNIYFSVEILWPEILFAALVLRDFSRLRQAESESPEWDFHLHTIAHFQALILDCLHGQIEEENYRILLQAFSASSRMEDYAIQYIDFLNLQYIGMAVSQRKKALPSIAAKIAAQDQDYLSFRQQVIASANPSKKAIHEIPIQTDYPETILW
ncbi:hypothetical protein [Planomicrobium sp. CPCC 101079]|uniref:DUF6904 family protein n=1 Tax=Planomicrobium sp. CPCC 101079 TaxID=2599618 RepID=UPI0011B53042|nr:hypothetical protein [Planomicrobium sp. CPCC 101079]TWT16005.1 hypothetical protein FQV28_00050 [Planomicrobium sp. CPCC 101079]